MGVMTQFEELAKKDDEILLLETRVQAYIARTSLLQTRLLSALNMLDAQQGAHAKELLTLAQDRERLKAKIRRYAEVVRIAEEERDDMRDAVLKLIEKVEISNDYSKWPHSQIYLSSLADVHIQPGPLLTHHPAFPDTEDLLKYAATMLKTVYRERDSEKRAHERTREAFEAHILSLEAKLSRRDAELESCAASAGHGASLRAASPTWDSAQDDRRTDDRRASWSQDRREISSEEMIGMLDVTAARNKVLEAEIKILARRLDQARAAAAATPDPAFSTAFGLPRASSRSSPAPLSPSRPQRRRRPPSQQPRSNRHFSPCHDDDNTSTANPTPEVLEHPFKALERQIRELSSKIDEFAQERQLILGGLGLNGGFQEQGDDENFWPETPAVEEQFELENEQLRRRENPERPSGRRNIRRAEEPRPADDNREDGGDDDGLYERLRLLEEECERLRSSEARLQDQLHFLQITAQRREDELEMEVDTLRRALDFRMSVGRGVGVGAGAGVEGVQEIPAQLTPPSPSTLSPTLQARPPSGDPRPTHSNQTGHARGPTQTHRRLLPPSGSSSISPSSTMPTVPPYLTGGALLHPIQPHRGPNQRDNLAAPTGAHLNSQSAAIASAEDHQLPQKTNFHQRTPLNHPDEPPFPDKYRRPPASGSSNEAVVADMQANLAQEPVVFISDNDEPNLGPPPNAVRRKSFVQNLLDDQLSDGEMSMELATPLLPVSMISIPVHPSPPLVPSTTASSQAPSSSPGAAARGLSHLISIPSLTLPIEGGDPQYVSNPHGVLEVGDRRTGEQINEGHDDRGVEFNTRTDREHDQIGPQPSPSSSLGTSASSPHSVTASMPLEDPFIVPRLVPGSMLTSTPPPSHLSHRRSHHSHHHSNPFDLHVDHGNPDDTDGPPGYEYEHSFDDTHHSFDLRSDEGSPTLSQMMLSAAASASSSAGLTSGARSGTHSGANLPDSMRSPAHSLGVLHPAQTSAVNARAKVNAEDLTSELERVEAELMSTQTELEVGEDVLAHLEDLVRELRRRERQEAEDEKQSGPS